MECYGCKYVISLKVSNSKVDSKGIVLKVPCPCHVLRKVKLEEINEYLKANFSLETRQKIYSAMQKVSQYIINVQGCQITHILCILKLYKQPLYILFLDI